MFVGAREIEKTENLLAPTNIVVSGHTKNYGKTRKTKGIYGKTRKPLRRREGLPMRSYNKPDFNRPVVDDLQHTRKIDNLQQDCVVFGCVCRKLCVFFTNIIFFSLLDSDWLKSVPINP